MTQRNPKLKVKPIAAPKTQANDVGRRVCEHLRSSMLETEGGTKLVRQCDGCQFFLVECGCGMSQWTEHPDLYCSATCKAKAAKKAPPPQAGQARELADVR